MKKTELIDNFNRNLNYLRVSITDRCNLRCVYCVPSRDNIPRLLHSQILRYEEIIRIIRMGVKLGITKIRITGGEPLVRKGVYDFLKEVNKIKEIEDLSLTTNGVLLRDNLEKLKDAGIKRLNFSLDTLDRQKYEKITGSDAFDQVWEGIIKAYEYGFSPIKINTVVMKGINDDELAQIAGLSFSYPFHMRFIEYMPIGIEHLDRGKQLLAPEIMNIISDLGKPIPIEHGKNDGPAERYRFENAKGEIGIIRPLSHHFCGQCNRLRLTASGGLRPCLLSDRQEDIKGPLRNGASDRELIKIFLNAVKFKPLEHKVGITGGEKVATSMSSIGG